MALDMRFDSRLIERNLEKGVITQEEYEAHLEGLEDVEEKAETLELVQPLFAEEEDEEGEDEEEEEEES